MSNAINMDIKQENKNLRLLLTQKIKKIAPLFSNQSRQNFLNEYIGIDGKHGYINKGSRFRKNEKIVSDNNDLKQLMKDFDKIIKKNQFGLNKKKYNDILNDNSPFEIKKTQLDKIKYFTKYNFNYYNDGSLKGLFDSIIDAVNNLHYKNKEDASSVSIYFRDIETGNKIRHISIMSNYLDDFSDFEARLNEIISGNMPGSDAVDLNEIEIIYDYFGISIMKLPGASESHKMLFNTFGIKHTFFYFNQIVTNNEIDDNKKKELLLLLIEDEKMKIDFLYNIEKNKNYINIKNITNLCKKYGLYGDCVKQCLFKIYENDENIKNIIKKTKLEEINNVIGLKNFLLKKGLNVAILANGFHLNESVYDIIERDKLKIKGKNEKNKDCLFVCGNLKQKDITIQYLFGEEYFSEESYCDGIIIYDEYNEHFDLVPGKKYFHPELLNNIYVSKCSRILKKYSDDVIYTIFTTNQINLNVKLSYNCETKYIFFDYETVINFNKNSCMSPYSLSILILTEEELKNLCDYDEKEQHNNINEIRQKNCKTFLGFDCSEQFIKWFIENQNNITYQFVGFNNSNFDNFILLDAILNFKEENYEIDCRNIFYNGSQLLNFYINGRHDFFDIRKHLVGSLKDNCKSFKIKSCSKKSFDHNYAQELYENNLLIDYISNNNELVEYNEYDNLATAILFYKYRQALLNIPSTNKYATNLHKMKTIGSLIFSVFQDNTKEKNIHLPKLEYNTYKDLLKYKIAGRVEMFNGVQKISERCASIDVCSLYPYIMAVHNGYFPCGEIINTDIFIEDKIGFYYCNIDQSNLANLPLIYAEKLENENNWNHNKILENYLISNVMIKLLLENGCKVEIKNGFYFSDKIKSCEMFDFILYLMQAKNFEDENKKNSSYNPALRETLKLLMNSLSGKVIEGLHVEKTTELTNIAQYQKISEKSEKINFINAIGNKLFITYEQDEEKLINKQRPVYLGILIYDYAKAYMYRNAYKPFGLNKLLYTDTDSCKVRYSDFLKYCENVNEKNIQVPHWEEVEKYDDRYKNHKIYELGSKVFGSFEDEYEDYVGQNYLFYCLEKKSWLYSYDNHSKFRFKGINPNSILLDLNSDFVTKKEINHKDGEQEIKYIVNDNKKAHKYSIENKNLMISNGNEVKFFEEIYKNGSSYVLVNSFRKIVKNSLHNVKLGEENKYNNLMNKIQVNYTIKKIMVVK